MTKRNTYAILGDLTRVYRSPVNANSSETKSWIQATYTISIDEVDNIFESIEKRLKELYSTPPEWIDKSFVLESFDFKVRSITKLT